ncbi:MOSC-domain-containing protein [Aspergillus avenaceus]|uniref:MOSC-domain-containing protein n=1 Tax=Aspergillus avenaceus TaxID=36643 RepID=A0A5N6TDY2_ASPAV|nr:MOSC-domain-containing protein [Aspergillus avenaceus]
MLDTTKAIPAALLLLPLTIFFIPQFHTWITNNKSRLLRRIGLSTNPSSEIVALKIYPIKSCRGITLPKSRVRAEGLDLDRRWMLVDAVTHEFLTIRQIARMTLINTALSDDGQTLQITFSGDEETVVSVPAYPDQTWLDAHTTLSPVRVWDIDTDGYLYGDEVNAPFSSFLGRGVRLVYKGPTPRIMRGNGDPRLLGREQGVNFPDVNPVLIASEASVAELNARLVQNGADPITIERFRPNIIVKGTAPWSEDSWKLVRINPVDLDCSTLRPVTVDILSRCTRCQVPNVNPDTGDQHRNQPWDTLMSYRRIDEGMKWKPCFGMMGAPREEGVVEVGMRLDVLEETSQHRYVKGF